MEGLVGYVPRGMIVNVNYLPTSGALTFQAELSMGEHSCEIHKGVRSKDIFQFDGKLTDTGLVGVIKSLDGLHENRIIAKENTVLKRDASDTYGSQLKTYAEWESHVKEWGVRIPPAVATPKSDTQIIGNIDFRNLTYDLAPWCGKGFGKNQVRIKDGIYGSRTDWWFGIEERPGKAAVIYGDLTGDGRDEAVVMTSCGGMHATEEPYVFTMKDGKASVMARLESGDRAFGGYQRIEVKDGLLITERTQGEAACCPDVIERKTYKWSGTAFREVGAAKRRPFSEPSAFPKTTINDETIALHIDGLRNLPKEPLKLIFDFQGGRALLEVLGKERDDLGSRFPNDRCYLGAITAGFAATAGGFVTDALNDLAVDITFASLGVNSMPSASKDALYKFVLDVGSAYLKKEDLTVATARSVVERSLGYIIPFLAEKYLDKPPELLTASAQSLSRETVRALIKKEDLVSGGYTGNNAKSREFRGDLVPKTSATVKWSYNPKTHYLSAILTAQCERAGGGFDRGIYVIRFQIIDKYGGKFADFATVEIFSFGTR